jgi:hypothetical protein
MVGDAHISHSGVMSAPAGHAKRRNEEGAALFMPDGPIAAVTRISWGRRVAALGQK